MSETTIAEIADNINRFARERNVSITRIVLFGSEASGNTKVDSDIDLILISKDFDKKTYSDRIKKLLGLNRSLVKLTDRPFDLIYYSETEWENNASQLIYEAKQTGITIHS